MPSGSRLIFVRIRSGMANASVPREHVDPHVARGGELGVDGRLDRVDEVAAHPLELEVHPPRARFHVAAGHERAVVAPYDPTQRVERGVGAHQREASRPVQVDLQLVTDVRGITVAGFELVDDLAADLARTAHRPGASVGGPQEHAPIRWLAAAARVEDRPIEHDQRWPRRLRRGGRGPPTERAYASV